MARLEGKIEAAEEQAEEEAAKLSVTINRFNLLGIKKKKRF